MLSIENVAKSINPDFYRPPYVPVRQYLEFLMQQGLVDKQLGTFYLVGYEIARFSNAPLSQEQYMDIMKHLAAILQNMGYSLKSNNKNQQTAENESVLSFSHRSNGSSPRKSSYSPRRPSHRSATTKSISLADDGDAISLTQSTYSRSTLSHIKHTINTSNHSNFPPDRHLPNDEIQVDEDDDYSIYDEDEVRNEIYELLMRDRATSGHQI